MPQSAVEAVLTGSLAASSVPPLAAVLEVLEKAADDQLDRVCEALRMVWASAASCCRWLAITLIGQTSASDEVLVALCRSLLHAEQRCRLLLAQLPKR